jgi:hypothetical protein
VSYQRRRGQAAIVYPEKVELDARGHKVRRPDLSAGIPVTAAFVPQRSSRAEVPGQVEVNVVRMIVRSDIDVSLWSRVSWRGSEWDVVAPPTYHHGTRRTRHYSIDLKERPSG